MKIDEIKALADIMKNAGLTALKVEENGKIIELKREVTNNVNVVAAAPAITAEVSHAPQISAGAPVDSAALEDPSVFTVEAPMVGMFYTSPSPKDAPYVTVGTKVKSGDVLCIVEAMKLMNEIVCEVDGTIEEVCVLNEQVVEFGQPLFRIRRD